MEADGWISSGDIVGVNEGVGIALVWDSDPVIVLVYDIVGDIIYDDMIGELL